MMATRAEEECSDADQLLAVASTQPSSADSLLQASSSANTVPSSEAVGAQLVNPTTVRGHGDPMDLVNLAYTVQQADKFVRATTGGKLQVIVDQIRSLQEQARTILVNAKKDSQLHHAACNFTKVPGKTYHLYEHSDGSTYFSMLSPKEWGKSSPHKHLESYRLEYDNSWTPLAEVERRSRDIVAINRIMDSHTPAIEQPRT